MIKKYKTDKFPEPITMEDSLKGLEGESIYKYRLIKTDFVFYEKKVYRIQALKSFRVVNKGDLGGYVHGYHNLSQEGDCWIYDKAMVMDNALIKDNARVRNKALVSDDACVRDNAIICDEAIVRGRAFIHQSAVICDKAVVEDTGVVSHQAVVGGTALVRDNAFVSHNAIVRGNAEVCDKAEITDNVVIKDNAVIGGNAVISDFAVIKGDVILDDDMEYCGNAVISSIEDYIVFKNTWSSGRYFMYTFSNRKWSVGCFYGNSEELIEKAYADSKLSGDMYSLYVELVKNIEKARNENEIC